MDVRNNTIVSTVAGVGKNPLREQLSDARKTGMLWKVGAFGATLIPAVGVGVSYLMDRKKNNVVQKNQMDVLAKYYRFEVGAVLGMNPEKVTADDLRLAAKINKKLNQAIQTVENEKTSANRTAAMSNAAVWAVSGANLIPGAGLVGKLGTDVVAATLGGVASSMFDKEVLHVNDVVEHIDGKLKAGQPIDTMDIMMLRAAQDENWQKQFKERYKTPFHKMSPQTQQQVMASMPDMLIGAEKQAYGLNKGLISPQSLVMEGPQAASNFAGGVERRTAGGSFVNAETSRRLAAAQQQTSLN